LIPRINRVGGKDENQAKVVPIKDKENNGTLKYSWALASLS
jgi:hypothetical protein